MNPCAQNRKLIVWLALNALDAEQTHQLRAHLETCEGCRGYLLEISNVAQKLAAAEPDSNLRASESFHRRVAEKLQAVESGSILENLPALIRGTMLNWRVALPVTAALLIAAFALVTLRQQPHSAPPAPPAAQVASAPGSESDLAPTLANYQMIANQSLDKLDALLTKQGNRALPSMPIYTASTFTLANGAF